MKLELRHRQAALLDMLSAAFKAGHKRIMVCAPCGFGKTEVATAILQKTADNGKRGIFACDRLQLVSQTSERFDKYGLDHGIIQGNHWRFRPSLLIQLCSSQTARLRGWPECNLMIVDEAHILSEAVKAKLMEKDCYAIGLTATPVTAGLGKYFDCVINAATTNQLISESLLVPLRIFQCVEPDMEGVKVVAGEYEEKETEKRALQVVGDVVLEYQKHGDGQKFIGFAATIAHAEELQRQFLAVGINVATYTATDKPEDRDEIVEEFRKPDSTIRGILSVEALTRGFDVSDVRVLILARPLRKALHVHVQMLGRVMRNAPGKIEAKVFDHSGNCERFWDAFQDMFEFGVLELDDGKKKPKKEAKPREEAEMIKCPKCRAMHLPRPSCPACGHEYPKKLTVEHVPGTLKEMIAGGNRAQLTRDVWPQVCGYARDRKGDAGSLMAKVLYKKMTGAWPKGDYETIFETTEPRAPSKEVLNKIRSLQIAYAHKPKLVQPVVPEASLI